MKIPVQDKVAKFIVITGGPGAGKTAILEMAKKLLRPNSIILPEAASIIFGGGFLRLKSLSARTAAQSAIYHVQSELENLVRDENIWALAFCDRGTIDGLAYWPNEEKLFWEMSHSSLDKELKKYHAVIHLRSPTDDLGYNHTNPLRIETALIAHQIDKKIAKVWHNHSNYHVIDSNINFLSKAQMAIDLIVKYQDECC